MPSPQLPPTLRHLTEPASPESRWRWSTTAIDPSGRLQLPVDARRALDAEPADRTVVSGHIEQDALVLRSDPRAGRDMVIDRRGRLYVPVWLRRHRLVLLGACHGAAAVVIMPTDLLDATGDQILGRARRGAR